MTLSIFSTYSEQNAGYGLNYSRFLTLFKMTEIASWLAASPLSRRVDVKNQKVAYRVLDKRLLRLQIYSHAQSDSMYLAEPSRSRLIFRCLHCAAPLGISNFPS
jgi:hypothetical protein